MGRSILSQAICAVLRKLFMYGDVWDEQEQAGAPGLAHKAAW